MAPCGQGPHGFSLARSEVAVAGRRKQYPKLLVAYPVNRQDFTQVNRRREALAWLRRLAEPHRLVQEGFLCLGYATLDEVCEQAGGFSSLRRPNALESRLLRILEQAALEVFGGVLALETLPPCQILEGTQAPWKGMATYVPLDAHVKGHGGARVRHHLARVALQARLFQPGEFDEALTTYLHELAHRFGGDSSVTFSYVLTALLEVALARVESIHAYRARWEASCTSGEPVLAARPVLQTAVDKRVDSLTAHSVIATCKEMKYAANH